MKYLLVALVVMIGIGIWRNNRRKEETPPPSAPSPQHRHKVEHMVSCAHCGVHLPVSDAITTDDRRYYCTSEHRRLGPQ